MNLLREFHADDLIADYERITGQRYITISGAIRDWQNVCRPSARNELLSYKIIENAALEHQDQEGIRRSILG